MLKTQPVAVARCPCPGPCPGRPVRRCRRIKRSASTTVLSLSLSLSLFGLRQKVIRCELWARGTAAAVGLGHVL